MTYTYFTSPSPLIPPSPLISHLLSSLYPLSFFTSSRLSISSHPSVPCYPSHLLSLHAFYPSPRLISPSALIPLSPFTPHHLLSLHLCSSQLLSSPISSLPSTPFHSLPPLISPHASSPFIPHLLSSLISCHPPSPLIPPSPSISHLLSSLHPLSSLSSSHPSISAHLMVSFLPTSFLEKVPEIPHSMCQALKMDNVILNLFCT